MLHSTAVTHEYDNAGWIAQLRKGVLELCVLALIAERPRYGYEIVAQLSDSDPLAALEGTLYPLLRRLRQANLVETHWQQSEAGPPRQYYTITAAGRRALRAMRRSWHELVASIDPFVGEAMRHERGA